MKYTLLKLLIINIVTYILLMITPSTYAAISIYYSTGGYSDRYHYRNHYYPYSNNTYYQCRWIRGHYEGRRWVSDRKVCSVSTRQYYQCQIVPAHYERGYYIPTQKVCW